MLARLALRMAAIEALAPSDAIEADGPFPTIAGPRVYDSRQAPIDGADDIEGQPILIVYTEMQDFRPYASGSTRPDYTQVQLIVEMMIASTGIVTVQLPDGSTQDIGTLDAPIMEAKHEALLDLLEATVRRRLEAVYDASPEGQRFRAIAAGFAHVESVPARDDSRTVRLAARTLTFHTKIKMDGWPDPSLNPATPTGLDALPEPLRSLAKALPASSPALETCASIAALLANPAALTPLSTIVVSTNADRSSPPSPADVTAQVNF